MADITLMNFVLPSLVLDSSIPAGMTWLDLIKFNDYTLTTL
jgi:hypothetical protein